MANDLQPYPDAADSHLSFSYKLVWGVAALGTSLISGTYGALLPIFYQDYLGLSARWISLASLIYAIWNAINDPLSVARATSSAIDSSTARRSASARASASPRSASSRRRSSTASTKARMAFDTRPISERAGNGVGGSMPVSPSATASMIRAIRPIGPAIE